MVKNRYKGRVIIYNTSRTLPQTLPDSLIVGIKRICETNEQCL